MKPPCRECKHETKCKRWPYLYIKPMNKGASVQFGSATRVAGKVFKNPCYECPRAEAYSEYISRTSTVGGIGVGFGV